MFGLPSFVEKLLPFSTSRLARNRGKTLFFCILLFLLGSGDEILVAFFDGLLHTARLEIAMIFRVSIGSLDWSENEPLWKKS